MEEKVELLETKENEWVIVKATGQERNGGWDLVHDIYDKLTIEKIYKKQLHVARRVMEVVYKLLPKSENALEAFNSIAYINIKKIRLNAVCLYIKLYLLE